MVRLERCRHGILGRRSRRHLQSLPGETLEFTTSNNVAAPLTYFPFEENVFRSTKAFFEGHAQIRSDCPTSDKVRADAEFATLTIPSGATSGTVNYKVINISRPTGIVGY